MKMIYHLFETWAFWMIIYEKCKTLAPKKGEHRIYQPMSGERLTVSEVRRRALMGVIMAYERERFWQQMEGDHGPS